MKLEVDLNADLGEGAGHDAELFELISSANIATVFHAGDSDTMHAAVCAAKEHGVAVGAHPSFFDRENFGRKELKVSNEEVFDAVAYQLGIFQAIASAGGMRPNHVKPHGALYNMAVRDQKLADAIFGDQNGGEAKDVLAGVDAAIARYPWIDADRLALEGGSYGGQLANWIITQTDRFKAAIPISGISNLVTQNYLSYYHDYLAVEFGAYPHEKGIIDKLWERSAIRYANKVKTPTMFVHGENDNDVPIAEAEQFYIALKDVGVETIMVRYPREGHGIRETKHTIDLIDRSVAWYDKHFAAAARTSAP